MTARGENQLENRYGTFLRTEIFWLCNAKPKEDKKRLTNLNLANIAKTQPISTQRYLPRPSNLLANSGLRETTTGN